MNQIKAFLFGLSLICCLNACTKLDLSETHRYQLKAYGLLTKPYAKSRHSILINQPSASAGYDSKRMIYVNKAYQLSSFANNSWMSTPANMLLPLVVQSMESSHYFNALAASPQAADTDYRLDLKILNLEQNFLQKPSQLIMTISLSLLEVNTNRILAEKTFSEHLPCPSDTPYGGVLAANQATESLTRRMSQYVISQIEHQRITKISFDNH